MICKEIDCTGCGACASICPIKCISMVEDEYGFIHPQINKDKCISCHQCERICPNNHSPQKTIPYVVYAAHRYDQIKRADSASGGIGAVLAEIWISQEGVVFGTKFDEDFHPIVKAEYTLEGIEGFKGSKYIQSYTGGSYVEVRNQLNKGKKVLFFGTPCQLAGLYSYLGERPANLLTVELLCHGVSCYRYFLENLTLKKKKIRGKRFDNVSFRSNRWMQDFYLTLWNNGRIIYDKQAYEDYYFAAFLQGLSLRESCYSCHYKTVERIGDIVIGDFIGLGKQIPFDGNPIRESFVACTTGQGVSLIEKSFPYCRLEKRTMKEALLEGRSLKEAFPRHTKQSEFRKRVKSDGFISAVDKTIGSEIQTRAINSRRLETKRHIKLLLKYRFHIKIENRSIHFE